MSEETAPYEDGNVVWVKLHNCWWPGEVIALEKVPGEVKESFRQLPVAVVRFFQEDTFEYVKHGQTKNLCLYNSERKNEFIKRGMELARSKAKAAIMTKFPADVCTAERLTGGNPNIINEPEFAAEQKPAPRIDTSLLFGSSSKQSGGGSPAAKRRNSGGGSGTGRGRGRGRGGGGGTPRGRGRGRHSTGSVDKFISSLTRKSLGNKDILITHPRFISDSNDDHEVVELIQCRKPPTESTPIDESFKCNLCDFKTIRLDVLVMHRGIHALLPIKRKQTSPKKQRKPQMPRSRTKTLEEDLELVRRGLTVEEDVSDDEFTVAKSPKKAKLAKTPTTPKVKKDKKETPKVSPHKTEEIKKVDCQQLVAEWNEVEESEEELEMAKELPKVQPAEVGKEKVSVPDTSKSCFDFEDEESEEIMKTIEGRKIPRVIPETERTITPVFDEVATENGDSIQEITEDSYAASDDSKTLPNKYSKSPAAAETDVLKTPTKKYLENIAASDDVTVSQEKITETPAATDVLPTPPEKSTETPAATEFSTTPPENSVATPEATEVLTPPDKTTETPAATVDVKVSPNKSLLDSDDMDLNSSIEAILESTSVPKLPEIPQVQKCEQNFRDTRTIKFPDKIQQFSMEEDIPGPVENNGLQAIKETAPLQRIPVVPAKTEVATRLTNPKKRFVRSFQEEKAKVQDMLQELEKEKLAKEMKEAMEKDLATVEVLQKCEENISDVVNEDLKPDNLTVAKVEDTIQKDVVATSAKVPRKSKYKPRHRSSHARSTKKNKKITDIINSFIEEDWCDTDERKNPLDQPQEVTKEPAKAIVLESTNEPSVDLNQESRNDIKDETPSHVIINASETDETSSQVINENVADETPVIIPESPVIIESEVDPNLESPMEELKQAPTDPLIELANVPANELILELSMPPISQEPPAVEIFQESNLELTHEITNPLEQKLACNMVIDEPTIPITQEPTIPEIREPEVEQTEEIVANTIPLDYEKTELINDEIPVQRSVSKDEFSIDALPTINDFNQQIQSELETHCEQMQKNDISPNNFEISRDANLIEPIQKESENVFMKKTIHKPPLKKMLDIYQSTIRSPEKQEIDPHNFETVKDNDNTESELRTEVQNDEVVSEKVTVEISETTKVTEETAIEKSKVADKTAMENAKVIEETAIETATDEQTMEYTTHEIVEEIATNSAYSAAANATFDQVPIEKDTHELIIEETINNLPNDDAGYELPFENSTEKTETFTELEKATSPEKDENESFVELEKIASPKRDENESFMELEKIASPKRDENESFFELEQIASPEKDGNESFVELEKVSSPEKDENESFVELEKIASPERDENESFVELEKVASLEKDENKSVVELEKIASPERDENESFVELEKVASPEKDVKESFAEFEQVASQQQEHLNVEPGLNQDDNSMDRSEINEANILINTGKHNSEELSALNTLVTLSELIQPEYDTRSIRKEEHFQSMFDIPEKVPQVAEMVPDVLEQYPERIIEKVPELNETVPEVLDKITVFPDDQLVKGQMEIVTLTTDDTITDTCSNESKEDVYKEKEKVWKTPAELDVVHEYVKLSNYEKINEPKKKNSESVSAIRDVEEPVQHVPPQINLQSTAVNLETESSSTDLLLDCNILNDYEQQIDLQSRLTANKISSISRKSKKSSTASQNKSDDFQKSNTSRTSQFDSGVIVSHTDTLAAAIANTIESEMAKLTDTAIDTATVPVQQNETSSSKLLEILSEPKGLMEKPKKAHGFTQNQFEGQTNQIILNRTSLPGASKSVNKTIILSDQVIKPARNESDSVVVQKVSNKRSLEDFEDIDAYIIQKPGKKPPPTKADAETAAPAAKIIKKSSPRSRPRILTQTIITPTGDVIQPDGQTSDDQAMFDINSMPIVLSDQILTPESIENMPMILQDSNPKVAPSPPVRPSSQNVKLLNKLPGESVIKASPKTLVRGYHKAPQRTTTGTKKLVPVSTGAQVKANYILVPSTASPTSSSMAIVNRKPVIKRQTLPIALSTKAPASTEQTGNKIMIFTNNLGQQQRVVLTPAQQKLFIQQNTNKIKTTTTTTTATKIIKAAPKPNILAHPKAQLITSTAGGQTYLLAPGQTITPLTPQQMKTAAKVEPSKAKVTKYIHTHSVGKPAPLPHTKTIIIKNQQGQTVKRIQGTADADLDRQVAEQIEAINKAAAKASQPVAVKEPVKASKHIPLKKVVPSVRPPQQQQQQLQQRKTVVKKTFPEFPPPAKISPSIVAAGRNTTVPPLMPLQQTITKKEATSPPQTPITEKSAAVPTPAINTPITNNPLNVGLLPEKDGEKRQLVMQDEQGNMSAIPVGQILAIPNETIDGQAQSYMLVTMDETGNLIPIDQQTLMSIDPNILGNMVVQNDQQVQPKPEINEKLSLQAIMPSSIPPSLEPQQQEFEASPISNIETPQATLPPMNALATPPPPEIPPPTTESDLANEIPSHYQTINCRISSGDITKHIYITGDPNVTQKFLESLHDGNADLINVLANSDGNLIIQADGHQIMVNAASAPPDNQMLYQPISSIQDRNPVMSNSPHKGHDILAAALADTDVLPSSKSLPSQLSPGTALYPLHASNVLETTAMSSPIMTPLEVTETHSKKIDDILGQIPKNVDLPITITDPNISHTVSSQQLSNDIHSSLDLPLNIADTTSTSVGMNSPSFPSYSLPSLDEDMSQKPFGQSISMPLLTDEPEETIATTEERTSTTDSISDSITPTMSSLTSLCPMTLTGNLCSSLSEPPPDMFDYAPSHHDDTSPSNRNFASPASVPPTEDKQPLSDSPEKVATDTELQLTTDSNEPDRLKTKEELFEGALTSQFHSPSTNTDDSCEIPVQPPIVTAIDKLDVHEPETNNKRSMDDDDDDDDDDCENESKKSKLS